MRPGDVHALPRPRTTARQATGRLGALCFSLALCGQAMAADMPPAGAPPGPPPEAVAACAGKTAGTTVSFAGRGGDTVTGVCGLVNGVLAARPAGGPPGHGAPPPAR